LAKLETIQKVIAIQATNLGDQTLIADADFYKRIEAGYDMNYNPAETTFMKKIREAGGRAYNGLKMLLYQGIAAYELWNQTVVPAEYCDYLYEKLVIAAGEQLTE
jgi:shikimate dehydrogenase